MQQQFLPKNAMTLTVHREASSNYLVWHQTSVALPGTMKNTPQASWIRTTAGMHVCYKFPFNPSSLYPFIFPFSPGRRGLKKTLQRDSSKLYDCNVMLLCFGNTNLMRTSKMPAIITSINYSDRCRSTIMSHWNFI